MKIVKATRDDLDTVRSVTQDTIREVYPKYYPQGAVRFFAEHHSDDRIISDIEEGNVFLLLTDDDIPAGTVTVSGNEINRLFVLSEYQGRGFGRALLDFAEEKIEAAYDTIAMDASLPAKKIYLKRGYKETGYNIIDTGYGDHLCYDRMERKAAHE